MSEISFCCPNCGHAYRFAADLGGKRGRCKVCKEVFRVPANPRRQPEIVKRPMPSPPQAQVAGPANPEKIVFNCPTCGHGYRLAAQLAGKQGRCTACRGIFTIPTRSQWSAPGAVVRESVPASRGREPEPPSRGRAPNPVPALPKSSVPNGAHSDSPPELGPDHGAMTFIPIPDQDDDDPEWWEVDSSEAMPAISARAGLQATATPVMAPAAPASPVRTGDAVRETAAAKPRRPQWVTHAVIAGGVISGAFSFAVAYTVVSNALRSNRPSVADGAKPGVKGPALAVAESTQSQPGPASSATASGTAAHQAVLDALASAYNDIADGYAQIRDPASIPGGEARISRAVERLKAAAQHGRSLTPLEADERTAFARSSGPPLLRAIDRVLQELRRTQGDPGHQVRVRPPDRRLHPLSR